MPDMSDTSSTPIWEIYFSLFQKQLDACQISDPKKHADIQKSLNQSIKECLIELKACEQIAEQPERSEIWFALGHASTYFERNPNLASKWYQLAADAGHTQAIAKLGIYLQQSKSEDDQKNSYQWLMRAAERGDPSAMRSIGHAYRDGEGVTKNIKSACDWLKKASDAGDLSAMKSLADIYKNHLHDLQKALPLYRELHRLDGGYDLTLAQIYNTRGSGVYDPHAAKKHYDKLARNGSKPSPSIMFELAKLHASGEVSENGLILARKWLYEIISQWPPSHPTRKKAEKLLEKLDNTLL